MTMAKRDKDWSRAVEADEAAAVRGGDGQTKKPPKDRQPLMVYKLEDIQISGT